MAKHETFQSLLLLTALGVAAPLIIRRTGGMVRLRIIVGEIIAGIILGGAKQRFWFQRGDKNREQCGEQPKPYRHEHNGRPINEEWARITQQIIKGNTGARRAGDDSNRQHHAGYRAILSHGEHFHGNLSRLHSRHPGASGSDGSDFAVFDYA